jgi:hypothetical protein
MAEGDVMWGIVSIRGRCAAVIAAAVVLVPVGIAAAGPSPQDSSGVVHETGEVATHAAARADCGPGSRPESALQGDVPAVDRDSGRSPEGYDCNITRIGGFAGDGAGIVSASYGHCAYMGVSSPAVSSDRKPVCRWSTPPTRPIRDRP